MKEKAARTNGGSSLSEWMCKRHGFQNVSASAKKDKPKCKYCGEELTLNTWTLSGSG